jgi:pantoate--beta-alanine ligase
VKIFNSIAELHQELESLRLDSKSIGLVPTMGNLHAGHLSLLKEALATNDYVVSTIFVNPLQFGPDEDLQNYPRTLEEDIVKLEASNCSCLFAPSVSEIYGGDVNDQTVIHVPGLSDNFCGQSRPGHFDGVATIVCKLFNIVNPDTAFFGLKDFQQFLIIRKLVHDLALGIDVRGVEIARDANGLALSSRNSYLSDEELQKAANIYRCLQEAAVAIKAQDQGFRTIEQSAKQQLSATGLKPDYFAICDSQSLMPANREDRQLVVLAAAYIGSSRLIDNIRLNLDS